jgi:thymidylate synthase (FAD)
VKSLIDRGHESMLEHSFLSVRFLTSRGVSAELTRHRHLSFAHESTRYCNYGNRGFKFILPDTKNPFELEAFRDVCDQSASSYESLIKDGHTPEEARGVLPLCLAAEVVASGNYREWRHVFRLRTAKDAHPDIRALLTPLLRSLQKQVPIIFDDIEPFEG